MDVPSCCSLLERISINTSWAVIRQGTTRECQQFTVALVATQRQLPLELAPLRAFLGCVVVRFHDERPDTSQFEEPFTELCWELESLLDSGLSDDEEQSNG